MKIPRSLIVIASEATILDNFDERLAKLTNKGRDFEKVCYDLMKAQLAPKQLKVLCKTDDWKAKLARRAAASPASSAADPDEAASSASASTLVTPRAKRQRILKRNLSEVSVPEELLASTD